ncbi:MAG: SRPBCC family protein [Pyrinomonadaceae bacterium]
MKPVRWQGSWVIRAPREKVYKWMTDFDRWAELMPDIVKSARVISRTDSTVVLDGVFRILGREGRGVMNIRLHPLAGFDADNTSEKLGEEKETVRFEEIPEGTLYKWTVEVKPSGIHVHLLSKFLGYFIRRFYERTIIKPLSRAVEQ